MSVHFRCVCSAVLNVPDDQVGTYGECPSCGKVLQAPERAVSFEPIVLASAPAPEPAVAFEPAGPATAVADEPPVAVPDSLEPEPVMATVPVPDSPEPEPVMAAEPVPDSPEPEPVMAAEPAAEPAEEKPATVFEAQLLAAAATSDEETVMAHAAPAMAVPPADQPVPVADPEYMQAQVAADDTAAEVPVIEPDTAPAVVAEDNDMYEARTLVDPIPNLAELEAIRSAAPEPTSPKAQQPAATGRGRASAKTRRGETPARGKRERRRPLDVLTREEEQYVEVKNKGGFFKKVFILLFLVIVLVVGVLIVHIYDVIPIKQLEENSVIGPYVRQIREILRPETIDEGATDEKAGNATENTETEAGKDTKQKEKQKKQNDQAPADNPGNP